MKSNMGLYFICIFGYKCIIKICLPKKLKYKYIQLLLVFFLIFNLLNVTCTSKCEFYLILLVSILFMRSRCFLIMSAFSWF
ncbi:hypothetical protein HanIR_Chr12g0570381 [Helianthus annuus]|nr:hypothetical protein HanIR_Chr12g0570381 [Helianthus annuus]